MLPVIAVFAISAGILLAAQSGCSGAYPAGADGSYNTPDVGLFEYDPVQAVTEEGGMPNLTAACQIADTLADMLFTGVLDTAYAVHGVLSLTAVDNVTVDSTLKLDRASGIVTFESGGHTYAAVAAFHDHSVQILNITNPYNITAAGNITDTATYRYNDTLELIGAVGIATFESGGHTYAAVTAYRDDSVQILDITDPFNITATDRITDTDTLELYTPYGITTFNAGGHTYAAVAAYDDDGVQILNITNPYNVTAADSITDAGTLELHGARDITTFESGGHIYAAVTALSDDGVQILNITNPYNITAADSITDTGTLELHGARDITTFESGGHTYAAVTAYSDDGVQILNITNPYNITAADSITDAGTLELYGANGIIIFNAGSHIYAAVAASIDDGVQILDITNPYNITAAASITNGDSLRLDAPYGIATFESGGHTYVVVTTSLDNSVQIIRIDPAVPDTTISDTAPTVTSIKRHDPAVENTNSQILIYEVTFSENVTGVDKADFELSSDSTGETNENNPVTSISGSGDTYYATVSATTDGTYNLDLVPSGHGIADTASNPLANTTPTGADETYTFSTAVTDITNPRLASIERYSPASQNTNSQSLIYEVTFSEDVTGVTASDFTLSPSSTGGSGTATTTTTGQFTQTRSPNLAILDLQTTSDAITVSDSATATSVSVAVDITHTYIGDLQIDLVAPDGTTETLRTRSGSSANNIDKTYTPSFGSVAISGVWTLQVHDRASRDTGFLNSWTLTINYDDTATTTTVSPVTSISGSGDTYRVTVSSSTDGTYNLDLVSSGHNIEDAADNPLTNRSPTGADETYTVSTAVTDITNPRLASIERYSPASQNTNSQSLIYEVTFSEDVTGVTASDFVLSSGSTGSGNNGNSPVTSISGSGDTYRITVSPSTDGTYNLDLVSSGHNIEDAADNPLTNRSPTGADETYTVSTAVTDITNPRLASIERYSPASQNTNSQSLIYEVTFSEDVTGVTASDFTLSPSSTGGGGATTTTTTGQFTQTRSPNLAILDLQTTSDAITVSDSATATSVSVAVDITHTYIGDLQIDLVAPDGTTETLRTRSGSSANSIDKTYTPSFGSVAISGVWTLQVHDRASRDTGFLNSWTLTINYDDTATTTTVSPVTSISGSGDTYRITVSPSTDGTYNLDLVSSGHNIEDAADNPLTNRSPTGADETYTVSTAVTDITNPRLASIERYSPASQNTNSQSLIYEVTFSEDVTGVTASDFVLSSGSTGSGNNGNSPVTSISGSGDTYRITVSPSTDGTYNLDLVSSGHNIEDAADNPLTNRSPTGADETYTVSTAVTDITNPRLASIERYSPASQNTNSQSLIYEVTFSEDVTGVTASDFTLSPSSTGGSGTATTTTTGQFTQTRSPNLAILDLQTTSDAITVSDSATATSVSVAVDITHTYIGDLQIDLVAPDGTTRNTAHSLRQQRKQHR